MLTGRCVAVDNTFASPVNQRPLELGADVVVHSATKYLGGHSDLTAGTMMGSRELLMPVWNWRKNLGSMIAPATASLLARSLRTLVVRVRQQNASAQLIAEAMSRHPEVQPCLLSRAGGLSGACAGAAADARLRGHADDRGRRRWRGRHPRGDRLELVSLAPSLGGVESLVTQPCTTTHHGLMPQERARRGISDAMLRLSVGLEDPRILIADLDQALCAR